MRIPTAAIKAAGYDPVKFGAAVSQVSSSVGGDVATALSTVEDVDSALRILADNSVDTAELLADKDAGRRHVGDAQAASRGTEVKADA